MPLSFQQPFSIALIIAVSILPHSARGADIQILQLQKFDGLNNGSIDLDISTGDNIADEGPIVCNLRLVGTIAAGDLEKLQKAIPQDRPDAYLNVVRLCLNSTGGSFEEGLKIVQYLTEASIGTALEPKAVCASACSLVFMGGSYPWKGQLNRFMHPSSTLAFHAPYLTDVPPGLDRAQFMPLAYRQAVEAVQSLMRLAQSQVKNFFPSELLTEMLAKGPTETYAIDTVGKAIRYRIHLYDARRPEFTEATFCNACTNYYYGALESYGARGSTPICAAGIKPTRRNFALGFRLEYDAAPRGGSCVVDVEVARQVVKGWWLQSDSVTKKQFGRELAGFEFAYWYLYPPDTPLTELIQQAHTSIDTPVPLSQPAPSPANPPLSGDVRDRVTQFIEMEHLQGREHFDRVIDYFEKGIVARDIALKDKAAYEARWPVRRYDMIPGTLQIVPGNGIYTVTFDYTYQVANGSRQLRGQARSEVKLRIVNQQFLVTGIKEVVQR
jgi:hypothetical protein